MEWPNKSNLVGRTKKRRPKALKFQCFQKYAKRRRIITQKSQLRVETEVERWWKQRWKLWKNMVVIYSFFAKKAFDEQENPVQVLIVFL